MVKKLFYLFMVIMLALTFNNNVLWAQEQEEAEDVADISLEDLLNVEITTAGRKAEKIGEIPASVVVISRKDIETYGYQSLPEILENITGLNQTNDLGSTKFAIRGYWTERENGNVIILVNDIPQPSVFANSYPLEGIAIPVEAIDRIEVVRGPMSVIYGNGAFFGVINIKTNLTADETVTMVSAAGGSEKTYRLFARSSGKIEDFQYAFNGSYYTTYGMNEPYSKMVSNPSILPAMGIKVDQTTDGQLEEADKYFNFSGTFKGFSFDASYSETRKEVSFFLPSVSDGSKQNIIASRVAFGYKRDFSDKVSLNAKVFYSHCTLDTAFDFLFPGFFSFERDENTYYKAELNLFYHPTPKMNITMGIDYLNVFDMNHTTHVPLLGLINREYRLPSGKSMITQAIYAQMDYKISDRLKLVLGARVEQMPEYEMLFRIGSNATGTYSSKTATYSDTAAKFIPRAALIFSPNEKNALKLLFGKAISRPSFMQNVVDLQNPESLQVTVLPETIQTVEANYLFNLPKFSLGVSVFYNLLENLIYRTLGTTPDGIFYTYYSNSGELRTTGAELTMTARPSEKFYLELSGTYQKTKDQRPGFEDIEPGYSPKLLGYFKASYLLNNDISVAVTGNYVDAMETLWDDTLVNPDGTRGRRLGEKVDPYFLLGANLRVRNMFKSGLFLNLRASNLMDKEFHYPTTSNNNWADIGTLGRGMSFLLTLGYKFIPQP